MFGGMRDPRTDAGGAARAGRALLACAALALALVLLGGAPAQAQDPARVLLFHGPVQDPTTDPGVAAIEALGASRGFAVEATGDPTAISAEGLDGVSAVVFLNTAGDLLDDEQEGALEAFIADGGGFLGIGSAAQSEPGTAFFDGLIGARPSADSETEASEQTVVFGDRVHPATDGLPLQAARTDVWYRWIERPTGKVHTIARYHAPDAPAGDGTDVGGTDQPISWCRDFGGGRSFYTGMGRTAASFADENVRKHLGGAIQWAAGLLRGNCKATIDSSYEGKKLVAAGDPSTGLVSTGESHGLTVAPNGWVLYIGRGDCRTDAERGALLGGDPFGRILDHADPRVGIGCGTVHVWDPAAANGNLNSGVTRAGTLAVYGDGGQGGERTDQDDHKMEYGLLGITTAPDFEETGHIYLQYFPTFDPESTPPGLPLERRVSKMSQPRISRFTMDLETKQLDLDSEVVIFQYDAQIYSCCHVGGGMGFDSAGNLYVTTGDTNSSQGSNGYSGNNPAAKCPVGPADEASRLHCGRRALLLPGRAPHGRQHQRLQRQDAPLQADPGPGGRCGRRAGGRQHLHAADGGRPERAEPVQRRARAAAARPGPRSTPWACATRRACRSIPRRTCPTRPGSARTRASRARRRVRPPTRTRRRSTAPATTAGPTAWAAPRPTATASAAPRRRTTRRRPRCATPTHRATCPAAPAATRRAGTTARTCATTPRTTPASSSSRTRRARGWTRARSARRTSGTAAATRTTRTAAPSTRVRAGPAARRTTAASRPRCARTRSTRA